jgi:hypothetical protein
MELPLARMALGNRQPRTVLSAAEQGSRRQLYAKYRSTFVHPLRELSAWRSFTEALPYVDCPPCSFADFSVKGMLVLGGGALTCKA